MDEKEKIIEGLKQHRDGRFHSCDNCPYVNDTDCQRKLYSDALALLKEQEEQIRNFEGGEETGQADGARKKV